ncbi:MetQ/NlpA family ABC transporter substrate-binding protein [Corynebacterium sp. MSK035]|uniref:MetQ/NlpA family ABC transporter substrate-binding protein n=1 Tax=Corynebacterium sp. MSK035 TaxID=3050192 RepID=UPI00254C2419|nr:MetQ/NlpA family ABC transporter substrate-binding protein [Corynebacterium sp. MSK035]MDK8809698.1 MetQ/NlpA family ABC transporter substrate-binding protein [Corynebacterium sp. MSK035]
MNLKRFSAGVLTVAFAATGLTACGSSDDAIRIGTTDAGKKAWTVFEQKASEQGIDLDVQSFSDYQTPNRALDEGQLDVNLFQHIKFLAEYNVDAKSDLTPIGSSEIVPLALFWKDHKSVDELKKGTEVVIPNDPSNQGRAINVLVQAGLLKLKQDDLLTPSPADIDKEASKITVLPVDAAQTPAAYGEGKPAIINNSFLDRAGIDPNTAIFQDDPNSTEAEPYINVFVTKAENADNPKYAELSKIWHSKEVQDAVAEDSKGTSVPVDRSAEELQDILNRVEEQQREQN